MTNKMDDRQKPRLIFVTRKEPVKREPVVISLTERQANAFALLHRHFGRARNEVNLARDVAAFADLNFGTSFKELLDHLSDLEEGVTTPK
jgi:hypothetical protein